MAIVIEEKKTKSGFVTVILWLVVLGIIIGAAYYLFFNQPQLIEVVVPGNLQSAQNLTKISVNPQIVEPLLQSLHSYIQSTGAPTNIGRPNPFISY
ncbi:MAG: hypothetical protein M1334_02525 [Patescibacteria group bacterium]|nr:hypothetical protein [Patescibacteria group bacterium]